MATVVHDVWWVAAGLSWEVVGTAVLNHNARHAQSRVTAVSISHDVGETFFREVSVGRRVDSAIVRQISKAEEATSIIVGVTEGSTLYWAKTVSVHRGIPNLSEEFGAVEWVCSNPGEAITGEATQALLEGIHGVVCSIWGHCGGRCKNSEQCKGEEDGAFSWSHWSNYERTSMWRPFILRFLNFSFWSFWWRNGSLPISFLRKLPNENQDHVWITRSSKPTYTISSTLSHYLDELKSRKFQLTGRLKLSDNMNM